MFFASLIYARTIYRLHTFRGVLQFRLPSAPQRYNTLDFPTENRVPTGMLLAPIGNPEPRGYSPLDTLFFVACVYTSLLQFVYVTISENKNSHRFHPIRHETCGIFLKTTLYFSTHILFSPHTKSTRVELKLLRYSFHKVIKSNVDDS